MVERRRPHAVLAECPGSERPPRWLTSHATIPKKYAHPLKSQARALMCTDPSHKTS